MKFRKKTIIETSTYLSLGVSILCFLSGWETTGRWFLAYFFLTFIPLIFYDLSRFIYKKIKKTS